MATKDYDFGGCEFESCEQRLLPPRIQKMIRRALDSFGFDKEVMAKRWSVPIEGGGGKLERDQFVYPDGRLSGDICCADTAAWVLYQTGVLDHGTTEHLWTASPDARTDATFHAADYWIPYEGNKGWVKLVGRYAKGEAFPKPAEPAEKWITDHKVVDPDKWLPGDYFLYSRGSQDREHPPGQPSHINVYLGDFKKTRGELPPKWEKLGGVGGVYCVINGSIGLNGEHAGITPQGIDRFIYYLNNGWTIWHCRCVPIENLYKQWEYGGPFDPPGVTPNPWRIYANNESLDTGAGGLYAFGAQRNLHGGIHVFPGAAAAKPAAPATTIKSNPARWTPVRAMAPGYIVAARLPPLGTPPMAKDALTGFQNWPGFVLVRHLVQELPKAPSSSDPVRGGTLYSLYMHVATPASLLRMKPDAFERPDAHIPDDEYVAQVPWYKHLVQRRFGAWVRVGLDRPKEEKNVDPKKGKPDPKKDAPAAQLGDVFWSRTRVDPANLQAKYAVYGTLTEITRTKGVNDKDVWLYKPSPAPLVKALDGLVRGDVVTFNEPFFPVQAFEAVGLAGAFPEDMKVATASVQIKRTDEHGEEHWGGLVVPRGFVHWEIFVPANVPDDKNAISLILEYAAKLQGAGAAKLTIHREASREKEADNYLELDEIKELLTPPLPQDEAKAFVDAFEDLEHSSVADKTYYGRYVELLDERTTFAPKNAKEDFVSKVAKLTYPVDLEIEGVHLPPPDQNTLAKGVYRFHLAFQRQVGESYETIETGEIALSAADFAKKSRGGTLKLGLQVPAEADQVTITPGPGLYVEEGRSPEESEVALLSTAVSRRWRNVRLVHPNEWSQGAMQKLVDKLNAGIKAEGDALGQTLPTIDGSAVVPFAWCGAKETAVGRALLSKGASTPEALGSEGAQSKPLFGDDEGQIPKDGAFDALHPVTALWLLNALKRQGLLRISPDLKVPLYYGDEKPKPFAWGWVLDKAPGDLRLGDRLVAIVVDNDFGYDNHNTLKLLARGEKTIELSAAVPYGREGVIVRTIDASFWGKVSLGVDPGDEKPPFQIGHADVTIPELTLGAFSERERDAHLDIPFRTANGFGWLVKVGNADFKSAEAFVTFEVSPDGESWAPHDAVLPVILRGAAGIKAPPEPALKEGELRFDENHPEIIVGAATGTDKKKGAVLVAEKGIAVEQYRQAYTDVRVACSFVQAMQALRTESKMRIGIKSIDRDGNGGTFYAIPDAGPPAKDPQNNNDTLLDKARAFFASAEAVKAAPAAVKGKAAGPPRTVGVKVRGKEPLKPAAECPAIDPKTRAGLAFDPTERFIVGSRGGKQVSAHFSLAELAGPYHVETPLRLEKVLAKAVHRLGLALGAQPSINHLDIDGLRCAVQVNKPDKAATAAAELGLFLRADADGGLLRLTPFLEPDKSVALTFDPTPFLLALRDDKAIAPGERRYYRFTLEVLNGGHSTVANGAFGEGKIRRADFDEACSKALGRLTFGPSPVAGSYRKIAFGEKLSFALVSTPKACSLRVRVPLLGAAESWMSWQVRLVRKASGKPSKPLLLDPPRPDADAEERFVEASFPLTESADDATENAFEVDAVPRKGSDPRPSDEAPRRLEGSFDLTPRWEGAPTAVLKDTEVVFRAQALGVEPFPMSANGTAMSLDAKTKLSAPREFVVEVFDAADRKKRLEVQVTYNHAHPSAPGRGFCDDRGVLVAVVDRAALPPGRSYVLTISRPGNALVRKKPLESKGAPPVAIPAAPPPAGDAPGGGR